MATKLGEKTADIDMSGFKPRERVIEGQTPGAASSGTHSSSTTSHTGAGIVMDAITGKGEVSKKLVETQMEVNELKNQLTSFKGAVLSRSLDPRLISRSHWANRHESEFVTAEFQLLKTEISSAGGNVQPILVRTLKDDGLRKDEVFDGQTPISRKQSNTEPVKALYEIAFGHRRHQACLELGLPVNALVVEDMSDQKLFESMDRENRSRKNLSAWEQGRMYRDALSKGLYPSIRALVEALGVNLSDASRSIQLANLPVEIVSAFASPLDLQVRWAKPLADALDCDLEQVLSHARALTLTRRGMDAVGVFEALVSKAKNPAHQETLLSVGGKNVATLKAGPKGRATVEFDSGVLHKDRYDELMKLIELFLSKDSKNSSKIKWKK